MKTLDELLKYQKEIYDLEYTINLLRWELETNCPKEAIDELIKLISNYEDKVFKLKTDENYEILIKNVINDKDFNMLDDIKKRYIKKLYDDYLDNKKIPIEFYLEYVELKNKTIKIWEYAKKNNDYNEYKPYLSKMIDMTKDYYRYINNNVENIYDVMLDKFETGLTSKIIDPLFDNLKKELIPLIKNISKKENKIININYSNSELIDASKYLLDYIGFDLNRGNIGICAHGFTNRISKDDIRLTFKETTNPCDFVTTVIHEGGHGIFEQSFNKELYIFGNTCINNLFALHESQSRFYENILGRNKNFWIPIYDVIKEKLKLNISFDEYINSLNIVQESLIRTEADEVTYPLHIILRYEIERDLFNNKITVDELPEIWNKKMKEYLNVDVLEDKEGLMQDIHWAEGAFGYFPSYLLGSIYDGMFVEAIEKELGNIDDLLKNGNIKEITQYLKDNIYQYGGAYTSLEIIKRICNKELSIKPLMNYFKKKYLK